MILWVESDFKLELGFEVCFRVPLSLLSPALGEIHRHECCLVVSTGQGELRVLLLQHVPSLSRLTLFLRKDLSKA